jgi:formylglycine-generating enzyme required for sulfatase activity
MPELFLYERTNYDRTMISVPGGRVVLSDRRTRSSWSVDLAPFRLGVTPVTQADYADVLGERPSASHRDSCPVDGVSWLDAIRYCNARSLLDGLTPAYRGDLQVEGADGYRLPTEAEWEFACRAGTTGPRYGPLDEIAWYRANSDGRSHEVGGKRANGWGFHDMLGNVWNWCWDLYDPAVYGTYRVLRGGGWFDEPWSCRAGVRRRSHPTFRVDDVGFRVARSGG